MTPQRIQRRRTKGYRLPPGAVYVGRPTVYGNPWTAADARSYDIPVAERQAWAVARYRRELLERGGTGEEQFVTTAEIRAQLAGKDLACWCRLEDAHGNHVPCHADVLLEISNAAVGG